MVRKRCKCFGTSGTCSRKFCIDVLPTIKEIGRTVKHLYLIANKVQVKNSKIVRHESEKDNTDLSETLVYSSKSPDYCKRNLTLGSHGTIGRVCKSKASQRTSEGDHCQKLCRSCGHNVKVMPATRNEPCECKFHFCCTVHCNVCKRREKLLVCSR